MAKVSKHRYLHGMEAAGLGKTVNNILGVYSKDLEEKVEKITRFSMTEIVRKTRDTAPFNARAYHQHYGDLISMKAIRRRASGTTYVWYVKPPGHRLTHLLVHGHATRDGGRTRSDPFLQNALDAVLPEYEKAIERVIRNGK